jgi:hypothetical protein
VALASAKQNHRHRRVLTIFASEALPRIDLSRCSVSSSVLQDAAGSHTLVQNAAFCAAAGFGNASQQASAANPAAQNVANLRRICVDLSAQHRGQFRTVLSDQQIVKELAGMQREGKA